MISVTEIYFRMSILMPEKRGLQVLAERNNNPLL